MNKTWRSHKWEIFLVPERIIKFYGKLKINKLRPVVVLSNAHIFRGRCLIMECSSHPIDEFSILLYTYVNKAGLQCSNYVLPNRIHTVDIAHFKHDKRIRFKVPEDKRKSLIEYFKKAIDIL